MLNNSSHSGDLFMYSLNKFSSLLTSIVDFELYFPIIFFNAKEKLYNPNI